MDDIASSPAKAPIRLDPARGLRIAIVGAGFSGIGMAAHLKRAGLDNFVILDRGADLGGTWRDNDYPGCACDVPVRLYSFSFAQSGDWSRIYGGQAEILAYLRRCAARFHLGPHFRFDCALTAATWDGDARCWRISLADGRTVEADVLIGAWGGLSNPALPDIEGLGTFAGAMFHSARWDHGADLDGRRIAVIGTGASAIQFAPEIAPRAGRLELFQRTPPWIIPKPDRETTPLERRLYRLLPPARWLARAAVYAQLESRAFGFVVSPRLMKAAERIARRHLARSIADPALRDALTPHYTMGCKRVLISNDWYPMFNRPNVSLATAPIERIEPSGIRTTDGVLHEADALILGTGFQVNDYRLPFTITGRDGADLDETWRDGPAAYLGTAVPGFPNLFLLMGPNTGLGHNSMIYMIESQIGYVMRALAALRRSGARSIAVREERFRRYNAELARKMHRTVWETGCRSWYANRHGKVTALWPGFTFQFRRRVKRLDPGDYDFA